MSAHTPGPFICYADVPSTDPNWHIITTANRMRVIANIHIRPGNAEDEANARLLTAAPALLATLKAIAEGRRYCEGDEVEMARAAISKAETAP